MKVSGIYKIINKINSRYYVGSSSNIYGSKGRWKTHIYELNGGKHQNSQLQYAWNKYGKENFDWMLITEIPKENLLLEEQKYLDIAKLEKEKCYNTSFIAGKVEMTPEVRKKISESRKGRKHSEEWKIRMSEKMKGRVTRLAGWHHTEESKNKISENNNRYWLGKKMSKNHIRHLVESHIGILQSEESRKKKSESLKLAYKEGRKKWSEEAKDILSKEKMGAKNPMFGKIPWNKGISMSEETKLKISLNRRGKGLGNKNNAKKI